MRAARSRVPLALGTLAGAVALAACTSPAPHPARSASPPASSAASAAPTQPGMATTSTRLVVPAGLGGGALSTPRTLQVPSGWTASVWARVPGARMMAWTPQGSLLVSQPGQGDVVELAPARTTSGAPASRTLLTGLTSPQGLAFARVNGRTVLYVAESDQIDAYPWGPQGIAGARTVVAGHLPDADPDGDDVHRAKDVAVAPDGTIYFDVASSSNANPDDRSMSPQRGVMMSVKPDGSDLRVVERGVRNGEGVAVAPDGSVWTAVNNRDNISYPFRGSYAGRANAFGQVIQAYVNEHPPDEVVPITQGRDLGWPYCNPDEDLSHPAGSLANVPLVADAFTNAGSTHLNCAALPPINVGIPAHSAPLGMSFLEGSRIPAPWSGGAVVAVHGSWNRQPPRPPAVLWLAWDAAAHTLEPAKTLVSGFQDASGNRWGRPADVVPGPDGALYVTDDQAGAVYRLQPPG